MCSVDTFEAALSETEVANARRYWTETWAAGGVEAQHRAAWRNLVGSHGAGRAAWIVREYAAAGAPPAKADPADLVLVIATDAPPSAQEQAALSAFWTAVWVAEGDAAQVEAARQALAAAPGVTDADALIATFAPANLAAAPAPPATRADVAVDTVWLRLPAAPDAKTRSWTAPARVETLPDRFVVLGYQDDRVVFEAQGGLIPSPLIAGPDPSAPEEEQLAHDEVGALRVPDELRWMVDFDAAVAAGMGVKVRDLGEADLTRPLQRVIAIGVRLADDNSQGQARLEELLDHHRFGSAGLALVPQGTPTNNSDEPAAYDRVDDADAAYDALFGAGDALPAAGGDWWTRRDGEWLAHGLGIGVQSFDRVSHAGGTDLAEARAVNRALWPATFGYALETMLHPVLNADQVDATRWFQTHFVLGRGMLPSLRIGDQPYGVLPVSAISRWDWLGGDELVGVGGLRTPDGFIGYREGLAGVLATMREDWRRLARDVSFVGRRGDPHQLLLDVVGLHPGSAELHQRYAESLDDLFNRAKLQGFGAQVAEAIQANRLQAEAGALLARLGYTGEAEPDALSKVFFTQASRLNGPLVDDVAASEREPIRAYTADGRNYIEWLADAARGAFEDLRQERGFEDGRPPAALLSVLLRHALLLSYWDSSLRLHLEAEVGARRTSRWRGASPRSCTSPPSAADPRAATRRCTAPTSGWRPATPASPSASAPSSATRLASRACPASSRRSTSSLTYRRRGSSAASPSTLTSRATAWTRGCSGWSATSSPRCATVRATRDGRGPVSTSARTDGSRTCSASRRRSSPSSSTRSSPRCSLRAANRPSATRPTAATCSRHRSSRPRPPRSCAPDTSRTRRRRSRARWR